LEKRAKRGGEAENPFEKTQIIAFFGRVKQDEAERIQKRIEEKVKREQEIEKSQTKGWYKT